MTPTEALARALAEVYGINPGDEDHSPGAEHLTKELAALGYEVRPIPRTIEKVRLSSVTVGGWAGTIEQADDDAS